MTKTVEVDAFPENIPSLFSSGRTLDALPTYCCNVVI